MQIKVETRKAVVRDIDAIKNIADTNRSTLGFMRRSMMIESIMDGQVIVAEIFLSGARRESGVGGLNRDAVGVVVGFVNFRHRKRDAATTMYDICVAEPYRGKRIGRALLGSLCAEMDTIGKYRLYLKSTVDNEAANGFYQHMGFEDLGEIEPYTRGSEATKRRVFRMWMLQVGSDSVVGK
jgi:ribosomal protein S18 acetylase RimI-like enzyme